MYFTIYKGFCKKVPENYILDYRPQVRRPDQKIQDSGPKSLGPGLKVQDSVSKTQDPKSETRS